MTWTVYKRISLQVIYRNPDARPDDSYWTKEWIIFGEDWEQNQEAIDYIRDHCDSAEQEYVRRYLRLRFPHAWEEYTRTGRFVVYNFYHANPQPRRRLFGLRHQRHHTGSH